MDDLISRQGVINTVFSMCCRWNTDDPNDLKNMLLTAFQDLPSAQERTTGEWVIKDESYWRPHYSGDIPVNKVGLYCSECDKRLAKAQKYRNFCPNCGAKMDKKGGAE